MAMEHSNQEQAMEASSEPLCKRLRREMKLFLLLLLLVLVVVVVFF
jgi:predicted nucleic acid-binding Zn ribbon protein